MKLGDVVRNATVFNVATVKHESTCACLTGRNLFSKQDTELVEPKDTRLSQINFRLIDENHKSARLLNPSKIGQISIWLTDEKNE